VGACSYERSHFNDCVIERREIRLDRLIVTAASAEYGPAVLALAGSLRLNWPNHPPIRIYDIGLDQYTRRRLLTAHLDVCSVPQFCPHWSRHYTWKIWCLNDAPANEILWIDAGVAVLQSLDEVMDAISATGYFFTTNHELLDWEASEAACRGCGVHPDFRLAKLTLAAGMMGWRKRGMPLTILQEALKVALIEEHIAATGITHRHDQAILSLLVYKHLSRVVCADSRIYLGSLLPCETPGQKVWVHRRRMLHSDLEYYQQHIDRSGSPYLPTPPYSLQRARALSHLYRVYWTFGAGDMSSARAHLKSALLSDPTLLTEPSYLAVTLARRDRKLEKLGYGGLNGCSFTEFAVREIQEIAPNVGHEVLISLRRASIQP
jgi:hypothetical protein